MIHYENAIEIFKKLSYQDKYTKVTTMIEAIVNKSGKMKDIYDLLLKVENIGEEILMELYDAMMGFGRDMNDIEIEEKLGKTQLKLQKIRDEEYIDRQQEEEYLEGLLKTIQKL